LSDFVTFFRTRFPAAMNQSCLLACLVASLSVTGSVLHSSAQTPPPNGSSSPTPALQTALPRMLGDDWQGAKKFAAAYKGESVEKDLGFEIVRVQRLAKDRVGMSIVVRMDAGASGEFYIPRGFTGKDKEDPTAVLDPVFQFSLANAQIVEEEGANVFKVTRQQRGDPYMGSDSYSGVLTRGGGAFMGTYFSAPPPRLPSPNGKPQKPLTVSVLLPNGKAPIKGVVIPDVISQEP